MHLSVFVEGRRIASRSFCSAYGKGSARVVTDARGRAYVLLDYSVGHGSHIASDLLAIYRVDKRLVRRGTLISRDPIGPDAEASYHYAIKMPRSGGLKFIGTLKVTGQRTALDSAPLAPTRLRIDMR